MFEIYNLVSMIQSDRPELDNIRERIGLLNSDVQNEFKDIFPSKRTYSDEHAYDDRQVVNAFTRAGYTLGSYTLDNEEKCRWTPANRVKQPRTLFVGLKLMRYTQLKPTMAHNPTAPPLS